MLAYILRRLAQAVLVLLAVGLIAFAVFRYAGDPVESLLGPEASLAQRNALEKHLGLDDPVIVQYGRFVSNAVRGDFGISYRLGRPVSDVIAERLPATIELALLSSLIAVAGGILLGVFAALKVNGMAVDAVMSGSLIFASLPTFLIAILLIWLFAVELNWLPAFGRGDVVDLDWWQTGLITVSGLKAFLLPAATLGLCQMAMIVRIVRSQMHVVLASDYIRSAHARGLPRRLVYFEHALFNALVPVITLSGHQVGSIIAFSIVTESVFQWPGLGLLFIESIQFVDVPVLAAYLLLIASVFVAVNLMADLLCHTVDPRLGEHGRRV